MKIRWSSLCSHDVRAGCMQKGFPEKRGVALASSINPSPRSLGCDLLRLQLSSVPGPISGLLPAGLVVLSS